MKKEHTRIFLMRHGQVTNHDEFRYNGHFDVDITPLGITQMELLRDFLKDEPLKAVYSSDLIRTKIGADIIAKPHDLKVEAFENFREISLGRWEGLNRDEALKQFPEEAHIQFKDLAHTAIKGGETMGHLRDRVIPLFNELIDKHKNQTFALMAHGGVNRVILSVLMNSPFENLFNIEQDFGCLNVIDIFHCNKDGENEEPDHSIIKMLNAGPNQLLHKTILY